MAMQQHPHAFYVYDDGSIYSNDGMLTGLNVDFSQLRGIVLSRAGVRGPPLVNGDLLASTLSTLLLYIYFTVWPPVASRRLFAVTMKRWQLHSIPNAVLLRRLCREAAHLLL